ncbi:acyl-CoA thioesterase II [Acinetobacter qingfengensis]|uniref:Acyl-CoA thioesterase 2 n=1 Tax=Acinetobacter qingfengensis TaxID=1262585 RepID=A0A1E7R1A7_9GAMM|nr:acyl-CoA thioesterase II [Acinetobacter qingfengensis]KAA8733265.1 acyl-CoA thioesterase II [Acinetobacter qingfengensis]OEY93102.1 acyl-CoA thioesterase II [Acinetobacter qingfengensis]
MLTQDLIELLALEKLEEGLYRGQSQNLVGKRVFGGQVLGQALRAASYTVDRPAHSLHAYFLFGGDVNAPIVYQVEKLRDGKSFLSRNVKALQHGRVIFQAMISFAAPEDGLEYQINPPDYLAPEALKNEEELKQSMLKFVPENLRNVFMRRRVMEITPVNPGNPFDPQPDQPVNAHYMRTWDRIPTEHDEIALHQAIVAFSSDFTLMTTSLKPHGLSWLSPSIQCASLDHTIYFHRPIRADQWYLHDMHATETAASRGLNFGRIWQNGQLVASTVQEGLIRLREVDLSKS